MTLPLPAPELRPAESVERLRQFDPETGELEIHLPMAPSANKLHRSAKFGVHPSIEYAIWLNACAPWLRDTLAGWEPDRERWWDVMIWVHLGCRGGDLDNRSKATLDLLAGAYVTREGDLGTDGLPLSPGLVMRRGGLFDDDKRTSDLKVRLVAINAPEPFLHVHARPGEPPADVKAERQAALLAEKERLRQQEALRREEVAAEKEAAREEANREREMQDRVLVQMLQAEGVTDKIPGAVMEKMLTMRGLTAGRLRKVWRAHLLALAGGRKRGE